MLHWCDNEVIYLYVRRCGVFIWTPLFLHYYTINQLIANKYNQFARYFSIGRRKKEEINHAEVSKFWHVLFSSRSFALFIKYGSVCGDNEDL